MASLNLNSVRDVREGFPFMSHSKQKTRRVWGAILMKQIGRRSGRVLWWKARIDVSLPANSKLFVLCSDDFGFCIQCKNVTENFE